jgi:hypothetical protein
MKQYSQRLAAGLLAVLAVAYQPFAEASTTYGFYGITSNDPSGGAVADGEANLSVEVIDLGSNQVQFKFFNNSTSSLTDVYFDDGTLLGIYDITGSGGVSFSQVATPGNLPGGTLATPPFVTTEDFSADSNPSVSLNGVSQGEWVAITFDLLNNKTYADTLAALNGGSDLRIGVHVQSYPGGYSEGFINNPVPVPEAETYAMMLAGLGLVGWAARRRKHAC